MIRKINWDALGITASVICAIHCAILPLAVASLPVLGVNIIHNATFEYGMIVLAFIIGSRALWHGYRHHHRQAMPLVLFVTGLLFLAAKQIWHQYEFRLLPFAVLLIVTAHILNYRSCSRPVSGGRLRTMADKLSGPQLPADHALLQTRANPRAVSPQSQAEIH